MKKSSFKHIHEFIRPYMIEDGKNFRLKDHHPGDTHDISSEEKPEAKEWMQQGVALLSEMQDMLYAQSSWGLLLIFQAMDAAGKDGTIKHVMSGVNPQGVDVFSFKGAVQRRDRARFSMENEPLPPCAGKDRHLQPLVLRGGSGGAGASGAS